MHWKAEEILELISLELSHVMAADSPLVCSSVCPLPFGRYEFMSPICCIYEKSMEISPQMLLTPAHDKDRLSSSSHC